VASIAAASGTSKAGFYREFESRAALLGALSLEPEPDARQRILEAAVELVGAHGLTALSMDEVASRAGVSRANLYRLFPGKQALFIGVIHAYSPLDPVSQVLTARSEEPPEVVMPELARTIYRVVQGRTRRASACCARSSSKSARSALTRRPLPASWPPRSWAASART